jgi:hypothetical protein
MQNVLVLRRRTQRALPWPALLLLLVLVLLLLLLVLVLVLLVMVTRQQPLVQPLAGVS